MSNPGLNYEVKVTGASQGAADVGKVAEAAKRTGEATGKAAPQTKSLGEALASLGGRNNAAKDVLEGIFASLRGGEGTVFGLTKAFKGLRELVQGGFVALGPTGILVAGLGVLMGLLPKFFELVRGGAQDVETLEQKTKKAVDAAKDLGDVRLDQVKRQFKELDEAAASARKEFDATLASLERIDSARKAAALAENRARTDISTEQKKANEQAINDAFSQRAEERKLAPFSRDVSEAEKAVANASDFSGDASRNYNQKQTELARLLTQQAERETLKKQLSGPIPIDDAEAASRYGEIAKKLEQIPDKSGEIEALNMEVVGLGKVAEVAGKQLADAQRKLDAANKTYELQRQTAQVESASQARVERAGKLEDLTSRRNDLVQRRDAAGQRAESGDSGAAGEFRQLTEELGKVDLEMKPLADAVKETSGAVNQFASTSSASIATAASAIAEQAANVPPPIDMSPIATAQLTYHEVNLDRHKKTGEAIAQLNRQLNTLAQQLASLRQ